MARTTQGIVEELVRSMGRPAQDPALAELARSAADSLASVPSSELAPYVGRILDAAGTWYAVTGGGGALDRVAEVLDRLDTKAITAAVETAVGSLEEGKRAQYLRELGRLAVPIPALSPVLAALQPREVDPEHEALVARFRPYVDELFAALAKSPSLGSFSALKEAVRARLGSPESLGPYTSLPWAVGGLLSSEELDALIRRIGPKHAPAPNVEIGWFEVFVFKRVVADGPDEATEITREALREVCPAADEFEIGDEASLLDERATRALRTAAIRALDLAGT